MFTTHTAAQFAAYNRARALLIARPEILKNVEKYLTDKLVEVIAANLPSIKADYNEASYLYPFWQNYPPEDRGRQPMMDQFPWIEVGEHALGCKLPRLLSAQFNVRDAGLPTGADQRFVLSHDEIRRHTEGLTDSVWLFVDVKSIGPRDDQDHTVMSHNQVSGAGEWLVEGDGTLNTVLQATGKRASHDFHCCMPPLFVLSDGTIAPTIILAVKPVYRMLPRRVAGLRNAGQPLERIDVACIPNGLLLTQNPAYLRTYPGLLFPGKDDKTKDPRKLRARVCFKTLRTLAVWRHQSVAVPYP